MHTLKTVVVCHFYSIKNNKIKAPVFKKLLREIGINNNLERPEIRLTDSRFES